MGMQDRDWYREHNREQTAASSGGTGAPGAAKIILYIIGIPCLILLLFSVALIVAGCFTDVGPVYEKVDVFLQKISGGQHNISTVFPFITRLFVVLVCLPIHELAHAWTSHKLGDDTARQRISMNPFAHLDLLGTVMILLFGIGYAKPVQVNTRNFRKPKRDLALTAAAGPISNMILAILFLLIIRIVYASNAGPGAYMLVQFLMYVSFINISLALFNMIPIPPLDGSKVLMAFLPDSAARSLAGVGRYAVVILLIAVFVLSRAGISPIGAATQGIFEALYKVIALPHGM